MKNIFQVRTMTKDDTKKQDKKEEDVLIDDQEDSKAKEQKQKENTEVVRLQQRVTDLENQVKRVLADYQNLEKRGAQERHIWIQTANKELVLRFLPVLDTIMLAGKHLKDQGLDLGIQQFLSSLKQEGVEKIKTVGEEFNPHTMECTETIDGEENKVIEEVRTGYIMGDRVIRPAQVKVGKIESGIKN